MNKQFSVEEAIKYRQHGMLHHEIADLMGCSKVWVTKALKGEPKGLQRVAVDETKLKAIKILEDALQQLKGIQ